MGNQEIHENYPNGPPEWAIRNHTRPGNVNTMKWLLTPTAENSWRFILTATGIAIVLHIVAFAATGSMYGLG